MSLTIVNTNYCRAYVLPTSESSTPSADDVKKYLKLPADNEGVSVPVEKFPSLDLAALKPHELMDMSDDPFYEDTCDLPQNQCENLRLATTNLHKLRSLRTALINENSNPHSHPYTFIFFETFRCPRNLEDARFTGALSWHFQERIIGEKGIRILAANYVTGTVVHPADSARSKGTRSGDVLLNVAEVSDCVAFVIFKSHYQTTLDWVTQNLERLPNKPALQFGHFWSEHLAQPNHMIYATSPFAYIDGSLAAGISPQSKGAYAKLSFDNLSTAIDTIYKPSKTSGYHLVSATIIGEPSDNHMWVLRLMIRNIATHPRGPFQALYAVAEKKTYHRDHKVQQDAALSEVTKLVNPMDSAVDDKTASFTLCGEDSNLAIFSGGPLTQCFFFNPKTT